MDFYGFYRAPSVHPRRKFHFVHALDYRRYIHDHQVSHLLSCREGSLRDNLDGNIKELTVAT